VLDIADLYRDTVTVPEAFRAVSIHTKRPAENMERLARRMTGEAIRKQQLVAKMIDRIKAPLFEPEASIDSAPASAVPVQNRLTEGDSGSQGGFKLMPMTLVVTRDVADRYRGFLASIMPEIAPGVYVAPELSKAVRQRIQTVLTDWWGTLPGGSIVMGWKDDSAPGRLGIVTLGLPPVSLANVDGMLMVRHAIPPRENKSAEVQDSVTSAIAST
jgi:CRISPR-associated protein Cas2